MTPHVCTSILLCLCVCLFFSGSKPVSGSKTSSSTVVSSNGRVVNPFQNTPKPQPPGPVTVPHSNSDLNSRKMVVLQEYRPTDSQGLAAKRGEIVQVRRVWVVLVRSGRLRGEAGGVRVGWGGGGGGGGRFMKDVRGRGQMFKEVRV